MSQGEQNKTVLLIAENVKDGQVAPKLANGMSQWPSRAVPDKVKESVMQYNERTTTAPVAATATATTSHYRRNTEID